MKTKQIPVLIALAAGFITCIVSFLNQVSMGQFVRNLCLAVVIFYILGCIAKLILDKNFPVESKEEENQVEESLEEEKEQKQEEEPRQEEPERETEEVEG